MKKFAAIALVLVMALGFAACGHLFPGQTFRPVIYLFPNFASR